MSVEELLTRCTIWLSLSLYAATLATVLVGRARPAIFGEARLAWTAGCALLWLHVAAAFHFYHQWSHQAAYEATARDTELTISWPVGGGVYFNYLFTSIWTLDAMYWWSVAPHVYFRRRRWLGAVIHGFLLFMVCNATVTFSDGAVRSVAAAVLAGLAILYVITYKTRRGDLQ